METTDAETSAPNGGEEPLTWAALLEAYRTGERQQWSGLLLDRLEPWLIAARRQLHAVPPYLEDEDVAGELLMEVLRVASRWRPVCEDRWIPRRLVERAARKILKALLTEQLDRMVELGEDLEASERAESDLVLETPIGRASVADLRLIYRAVVIGQPIDDLAAEAGVTSKQMMRRLKSAKERARSAGPAPAPR